MRNRFPQFPLYATRTSIPRYAPVGPSVYVSVCVFAPHSENVRTLGRKAQANESNRAQLHETPSLHAVFFTFICSFIVKSRVLFIDTRLQGGLLSLLIAAAMLQARAEGLCLEEPGHASELGGEIPAVSPLPALPPPSKETFRQEMET